MIDLVFHIRRTAPERYRPAIKFANPELLSMLKQMANEVDSEPLKTAIEQLLALVNQTEHSDTATLKNTVLDTGGTRMYRGLRVTG